MKIYSQEKTDGLEEVIQANASLAYVSQLRPSNPDESQKLKIKASLESSKANSNKDQTDLYYIDSVLDAYEFSKDKGFKVLDSL